MLVVYWEPEIGGYSWYLTGHDRKHMTVVAEQVYAMRERWA